MLDVHEQQFLMLLFMMETKHDQINSLDRQRLRQHLKHCLIDMAAIVADLLDRGPGDHASLCARMARPGGLVVRVEQEGVHRVEFDISRMELLEKERLEEPCHVGPVPLRRAGVGHRLHDLVFGA